MKYCIWCNAKFDNELPCACPGCGEQLGLLGEMTINALGDKAASKGLKCSLVFDTMTPEEKMNYDTYCAKLEK